MRGRAPSATVTTTLFDVAVSPPPAFVTVTPNWYAPTVRVPAGIAHVQDAERCAGLIRITGAITRTQHEPIIFAHRAISTRNVASQRLVGATYIDFCVPTEGWLGSHAASDAESVATAVGQLLARDAEVSER